MNKSNKIMNIFGGFIIAPILLIVGIGILWWNEGRTVKTESAIMEAKDNYIDVKSDEVDEKNKGKLVVTSGNIILPEIALVDTTFNVSVSSAKLNRIVETYQWVESCTDDEEEGRKCTYTKEWKEEIVDSSKFEDSNYVNPSYKKYDNQTWYPPSVGIGAFVVPTDLLHSLSTKSVVNELNEETAASLGMVIDNNYYTDAVNGTPNIGNVRVKFTYNSTSTATIIGEQTSNSFTTYKAKSGYEIYRLYEGTATGEEVIEALQGENTVKKIAFRIAGVVAIIIGCLLFISPLQILIGFIPILGHIFNGVTSFMALLNGILISIIVIAIAWLRYRPLLSIIAIAGVILISLLIKFIKNKRKKI